MWSLSLGLVLCVVSFLPALFDHGEKRAAFKAAKGIRDRLATGIKWILINWGLPILAITTTIAQGIESAATDRQIVQQSNEMHSTGQQLAAIRMPRTITKEQESEFISYLAPFPKMRISIFSGTQNDETSAYINRVRAMLDGAGFAADEGKGVIFKPGGFAGVTKGYVNDANGAPTNIVPTMRAVMGKPQIAKTEENPSTFIIFKTINAPAVQLMMAFAMAGIEAPLITSDAVQPGEVVIWVGDKRY